MQRPLALGVTLAFFTLCVAVAGVVAQQQRATTIGVEEIRPGMTGYGLTVFRGSQPERFDVTVIDVLHNFRPDQDLILVRTDHPILDHASTVAGMSGSPIYLDNRLAGAYAYGWPFGKDPVAGVTPIAVMLQEMVRPYRPEAFPGVRPLQPIPVVPGTKVRPARPGARPTPRASLGRRPSTARLAGLPPYLGTHGRTALDPLAEHAQRAGFVPRRGETPSGVVPAATPLLLGGFTGPVADALGERLERFGLMALQAGGGQQRQPAQPGAAPPQFVDGGAIGVQLIRGDVSATGIGTVTHVNGRRLVAFGHPMMNAGEIGLPTCTARVLHVLASESRSFKIAEAADPLGVLIHDRQSAIVVHTDLDAAVIPVTLRIHGIEGAPRTEWNMEVASHRILTPMLVFAAITNALGATASDQTDVVFTANGRVTLENHGTVELEDTGYIATGPNDDSSIARLRMFSLMEAAYANPFEETRVTRVELDLHVRFARDWVEIHDAAVASAEVDPGARVNVHVTLRRFGVPDEVRIVPVEIPETAAGTEVELLIQPGDRVDLETPEPRTMSDIIQIIRTGYPSTQLVVSTRMPSRGLRFQGHVVRSLPGSALDALQLQNDTSAGSPFTTYERQRLDVGRVMLGSSRVRLRVRETPLNR